MKNQKRDIERVIGDFEYDTLEDKRSPRRCCVKIRVRKGRKLGFAAKPCKREVSKGKAAKVAQPV